MTVRTVIVAHPEPMAAEGIAAALAAFPGILPVAATSSIEEVERLAVGADALAIHQRLTGAHDAAARLRGKGVRVVFIAETGSIGEEGITVSPRSPVSSLASALVPTMTTQTPAHRLSLRQQEILLLVSRGMACKEVAKRLGISPKTVENHKTRIFAKLGVRNQTAAAFLALGHRAGRRREWSQSSI